MSTVPVPVSPAAAALACARSTYTAALMSDPAAPGYDRLCANAETAVWEAEQDLADEQTAAPPSTEPEHGHGEETCAACDQTDRCDCPCETCIAARLAVRPVSYIQAALDSEWAGANFSGPGCPFCDALLGGCSCWEQRAEMHRAEEHRQVRADRAAIAAAIARGACYCDSLSQDSEYPDCCDICRREEELRCKECGELQCRAGCCGGCGGCSRCRGDSESEPDYDQDDDDPYDDEPFHERMEREEREDEERWLAREERLAARAAARPAAAAAVS